MMKRAVISIGGSVLIPEFNSEKIRGFSRVISRLSEEAIVFIVVGGGKISREYISLARELGASEVICDEIGIDVTRINARILIASLADKAYPEVARSFEEAWRASKTHDIVVCGGMFPGQTTDAISALLAEYVRADILINATSVDGVYTSDPKVDPSAKKFERMTPGELCEVVMSQVMRAGASTVLDPVAAKIIERSRIRTVVVSGEDPENIIKAWRGEISGTIIE